MTPESLGPAFLSQCNSREIADPAVGSVVQIKCQNFQEVDYSSLVIYSMRGEWKSLSRLEKFSLH